MYGFGLIRELELQQEAGFQPLKVIQHATGNNARILGQEEHLGRVRAGYRADLIVVNGNPLEDFKVLYPTGVDEMGGRQRGPHRRRRVDHQGRHPLSRPDADGEVKDMVAQARAARKGQRSPLLRLLKPP